MRLPHVLLLWLAVSGSAFSQPDSSVAKALLLPTMRGGLFGGTSDSSAGIVQGEYRFAAHDLLDPTGNPIEHVAVELGKIHVRDELPKDVVRLEELTIFRILSVPPVNTDKQASWKVRFGLETVRDMSCDHCIATTLEAGLGVAHQPFPHLPLYTFLLADLALSIAPAFDHFFKPGLGPSAGIRAYFSELFAAMVTGTYRYQLLTSAHDYYEAALEARWMFMTRWALDGKLARYPDGWEALGGIYYYF